MTVTPKTMARQITVARQERTERARVARVATRTRLAYSTSTGVTRPVCENTWAMAVEEESDPHCFVCGRHTDHFAEHDDMVAAGAARYGEDGSVYPVPWFWD